METAQPIWKCIGHTGDIDPIAHGGGFVYTDITHKYGPELTHFEPGPDEEWESKRGETKLLSFQVLLESGMREWWYDKLPDIASYTGISLEELQASAQSKDPMELAALYSALISYFGAEEFDQYPQTLTEDEAYAKFSEEMKLVRSV